jgi:hypothetical protein
MGCGSGWFHLNIKIRRENSANTSGKSTYPRESERTQRRDGVEREAQIVYNACDIQNAWNQVDISKKK